MLKFRYFSTDYSIPFIIEMAEYDGVFPVSSPPIPGWGIVGTDDYPPTMTEYDPFDWDSVIDDRAGLIAEIETLRREVERYQAEAALSRTKAQITRMEAQGSDAELAGMHFRLGSLRDGLEYSQEQYREALQAIVELRTQLRAHDHTIVDLRQQVQTLDSRISRGMRYMRRSYQELDAGVYPHFQSPAW